MRNNMYYLVLVVAIMMTGSLAIYPSEADAATRAVSVTLNGQRIVFPDAQPFIDKQGRIQVPIRYIGNALQVNVDYSTKHSARTAVFSDQSTTVEFVLNTSTYYVNNTKYEMDTKSQVVQNRTFTPARYLAEQFGATVNWNASNYTVEISNSSSPTVQAPSATTAKPQFTYVNDEATLQQYQSLAVALFKNNATYISNQAQGIKHYETIISPLFTNKTELANNLAAYKVKSTAIDYHWKAKDIQAFTQSVQALSLRDKLTTQVFHAKGEKVLSYRYIVNVNGVAIWLEVQLTFKLVTDEKYQLVDIKA